MVIPDLKQNKEVILDNLSDFRFNNSTKENSKKAIIKVSTYSYGTNGKIWHYLSKFAKKE
ncbi:MAG: hypothetical protein ACFFAQ_01055 [Promethearchaeota archaeon]